MVEKPGYRTSEFLVSCVVAICATVLTVTGDLTSTEWSGVVGVNASVYVAGRSLVKAFLSRNTQ